MKKSRTRKSGQQASHAKTSRSRAQGLEPGSKVKEQASSSHSSSSSKNTFPVSWFLKTSQVYSIPTEEEILQSSYGKWPNSGILLDGECLTANISESPSLVKECMLWQVVETGKIHSKYFLSPNAATGILRRVKSQKRKLFPPLETALQKLSQNPDFSEK